MTNLNMHGAVDLSSLAAPPRASETASPSGGVIVDVTEANFQQVVEQSMTVPVVIDLWAEWCQPCKTLGPILEKLAHEYAGKFLLAKVDVDANQQIAAAFQVQSIPTVIAIVGGQPVPLFQGAQPEAQIRQVLDQVLQVAAQNGVTGTVAIDEPVDDDAPAEPELSPEHQEALALVEDGRWAEARAAYEAILASSPQDADAKAALAGVEVFARLGDADPSEVIAAAGPDTESQLAAADAEVALGSFGAAFERLLAIVRAGGEAREEARARLVRYFEIAGVEHPDVPRARRDLASALY